MHCCCLQRLVIVEELGAEKAKESMTGFEIEGMIGIKYPFVVPSVEVEAACLKIDLGERCLGVRWVGSRPCLTRPAADVSLQSRGS